MKAFTDFVVLLASTAVDGAVSHESIYCFHGSSSIGCSRWCGLPWKHLAAFIVLLASTAVDGERSHENILCFCGLIYDVKQCQGVCSHTFI